MKDRITDMSSRLNAKTSDIYAHRGCWGASVSQNSLTSFHLAELKNYSIETDIRLSDSGLIISHDPKSESTQLMLSDILDLKTSFALNIKEDGLQDHMNAIRPWIEDTGSFVFDGSIPEMYRFHKLGIPHALRLSEFENSLPWESYAVWLDSFTSDWWINNNTVQELFGTAKVIVVSPELHGRDPRAVWDFLANKRLEGDSHFGICTDRPEEYLSWC